MKLKTFPGKIAQLRACKCPACGREIYTAGIKAHILAQARKEALNACLAEPGEIVTEKQVKHVEFVRDNMVQKIVTETNVLDITF